jgi:citronellol/citronellal dehydrogenase
MARNLSGKTIISMSAVPHLKRAENPHILTLSPPIDLDPRWFGAHLGYTIAKFGMSMTTIGFATEFAADGIAANSLWPRTMIATAAVRNLLGGDESVRRSRSPEIMADAAHAILTRDSRKCTGNFFVDDDVLAEDGVTDFAKYHLGEADDELLPELFL